MNTYAWDACLHTEGKAVQWMIEQAQNFGYQEQQEAASLDSDSRVWKMFSHWIVLIPVVLIMPASSWPQCWRPFLFLCATRICSEGCKPHGTPHHSDWCRYRLVSPYVSPLEVECVSPAIENSVLNLALWHYLAAMMHCQIMRLNIPDYLTFFCITDLHFGHSVRAQMFVWTLPASSASMKQWTYGHCVTNALKGTLGICFIASFSTL